MLAEEGVVFKCFQTSRTERDGNSPLPLPRWRVGERERQRAESHKSRSNLGSERVLHLGRKKKEKKGRLVRKEFLPPNE